MKYSSTNDWEAGVDRAQALVQVERLKQFQKWGEQDHRLSTFLTILAEEVGELSEQILKIEFDGRSEQDNEQLLNEAIQVAAVATAIVQRIKDGQA